MEASARNPSGLVPAVDFYGDTSEWPTSELVHSEKLIDRSELHDWRIRPHRHNDLVQLFLVLEGGGRARLDSEWHKATAPCLIIIAERAVHEFEWTEASDGFALSIRSNLVTGLAQRIESLSTVFGGNKILDVASSRRFLNELFNTIHEESRERQAYKDISLDALIRMLAIWLARNSGQESSSDQSPGRATRHYARFTKLVEERHKMHWPVADYASALGITPSHLNAICQKISGKSTLELIHARLVLAARRELAYTERNIAGVAHHLGFADPSYFARFFKRETGMTPGAYRRTSGTLDG